MSLSLLLSLVISASLQLRWFNSACTVFCRLCAARQSPKCAHDISEYCKVQGSTECWVVTLSKSAGEVNAEHWDVLRTWGGWQVRMISWLCLWWSHGEQLEVVMPKFGSELMQELRTERTEPSVQVQFSLVHRFWAVSSVLGSSKMVEELNWTELWHC